MSGIIRYDRRYLSGTFWHHEEFNVSKLWVNAQLAHVKSISDRRWSEALFHMRKYIYATNPLEMLKQPNQW